MDSIWLDIEYNLVSEKYLQDTTKEPLTYLSFESKLTQKYKVFWTGKFGSGKSCAYNSALSGFKEWFICAATENKNNWEWVTKFSLLLYSLSLSSEGDAFFCPSLDLSSILFPKKTSYAGIYYKLELDFKNRTRQVCESQNSVFLADIVQDFVGFYVNISEMENFTNQKSHLRNQAVSGRQPIRMIDFFDSGIRFNKDIFKKL